MERNKRGISLIVLVITIIVMIILAGSIIISLSSTNIIDRANNAVSDSNLKQVQSAATWAWADAYLDTVSDIEGYIIDKLEEQGIDTDKYTVVADKSGVEVSTGWLLKRTIANGKVTEVLVKKGQQIIEVGSTVNYMPQKKVAVNSS